MSSHVLRFVLLVAAVLALLQVASAQSTPAIDEFKLPEGTTTIDAMCLDSEGGVWLAQSSPALLFKFEPSTGAFQKHAINGTAEDIMIRGMSAEGKDYIWIADQGGQRIYGYDVNNDNFSTFVFPFKLDPADVIAQGNYLWVGGNTELGRLNLDTNFMDEYYVDRHDASVADMLTDRQGNVWFVEYGSGKVGVHHIVNNWNEYFSIPAADSRPTCLGMDPQGRLWFIESGPGKLGTFDTGNSSFKEFEMPTLNGTRVIPTRIAVDGDGNVWLTDTVHDRIVKYYPEKDVFVPLGLNGSKVYPTYIEASGNAVWVVEGGTRALARIVAGPQYGLTTATTIPAGGASAAPKQAPGLEAIATLTALTVALWLYRRNG